MWLNVLHVIILEIEKLCIVDGVIILLWENMILKQKKMNKEYQKTITDDNLTYGKCKNYNSTAKEKKN